RANRGTPELPVGDWGPADAPVGGLPQPAASGPEVVLVGTTGDPGGGDGAAAPVGTDVTPGFALEPGGIKARRSLPQQLPAGQRWREPSEGHKCERPERRHDGTSGRGSPAEPTASPGAPSSLARLPAAPRPA